MNIYIEIERLLNYGVQKNILEQEDVVYTKNLIFDIFKISGEYGNIAVDEKLETCTEVLENIANFAIENSLIANNMTEIDLFTTKVMGTLTPKPSAVNKQFFELYNKDKTVATDYFYKLSRDVNYIMVDRVKKNREWDKETEYGKYKITINVSKPEKTPEEIKMAKLVKSSGYPKCLLCSENVGFAGNMNHPARQNLRTIPLKLNNEDWELQYSPYVYYNEHCIVFNKEHTPMKINKETFVKLLDFVEFLPHYFVGSNADLPIVGGSILSHDHFQGGNYELPMARAKDNLNFESKNYKGINLSILNWPMSVIRLTGKNKETLIELANEVLEKWRNYSASNVGILSHTDETPHNTITPIARMNKTGDYELDLVLRNNRTSEEHPDGIFHTHKETHNVKKENIGLIEVMGLAVLPKRLIDEFEEIKTYLNGTATTGFDKDNQHYDWVQYLIDKYGTNNSETELEEIFEEELGIKFESCLVDCGVFKVDEIGLIEFEKFINTLGFNVV